MIELRSRRQLGRLAVYVLAIAFVITEAQAAEDFQEAWVALAKGGHIALIRHGNAPPGYGGDPPGFKMDDCKTQRNLDELGRQQAQALGAAFRQHGVRVGRILASPVCRCVDTAELMAVGPVEKSVALLPDRTQPPVRLLELKTMVAEWRGPGTLVLVTHGFTISPLLRTYLEQAETLVLKPGGGSGAVADIVGRIPTPQ
jgi:phosphohistidine phosphatase SixA